VDYEALAGVGAIMGSGGLVVLDETDCMVDIARYFLQFTQNESCGKCTCCRIGTKTMLEILERLCRGDATLEDIDRLEELARIVQRGSRGTVPMSHQPGEIVRVGYTVERVIELPSFRDDFNFR